MDASTPTWTVKQDGSQVELLKHQLKLPADATDKLIKDTAEILGLCGSPSAPTSAETGLALGYVQSGKTMSFTTLIAMARDNGYQVIIVLAGTQNALVDQSVKRLKKDLQIDDDNSREWRILPNPDVTNSLDNIGSTLKEYKRGSGSRLKQRTTIVAVTKNRTQLDKLIEVIEQLRDEFEGVPTLIVDDEADQAGMNTENKKNRDRDAKGLTRKKSPVYAQLLRLKNALPHHTYVQYTATPQALLFIERQDDLSPNFIKLLTPGVGYTGGKEFFTPPMFDKLVYPIADDEVHSRDHHLASPPNSLREALCVFFLGAADYLITGATDRNRSMMVHPSQYKAIHLDYYNWVNTLKATWERLLEKPADDVDRQQLVEEFRKVHSQLLDVNPKLAAFEEHLDALHEAISATQVKLLNTSPNSAPSIEWKSNEFFILVGGQVLSRGFTVEGLTVTYMPRSIGTGTADTMQQWARFFGYKQRYLHLCRIYLTEDVIEAYVGYVRHEIDMRSRLKAYDAGRTLNQYERVVELPVSLRHLTRGTVIYDELERYRFGGAWITTLTVQGTKFEIEQSQAAVQDFIKKQGANWHNDPGHKLRTATQRHLKAEVPLADIAQLLRSYKYFSTDDTHTFDLLANSLERYISANADAKGAAYQMSPSVERKRTARDGKLGQGPLFQGSNPAKDGGEDVYKGDRSIKENSRFTVQIHQLKVINKDQDGSSTEFDTLALAVWVPLEAGVEMVKLAND
ncbi:alpha-1,4 polygalactosaminidase [Hymenobacter gummosus]|uniref:Alpha-1,4 polygalactosaminidase n=1 Tax=Hymenobacter gummosus TaxID=1776032 RepID=A0A3S0JDK5_9BACT|nr:Z1 domain-containing protein [Hymenobacter gummosus]RTQ45840.1 alpha-1,4 polygalactosaminidase [Hymenobacter gummosus]